MRGTGPVPVMSPMSKSFRKRERPVKNSSKSSTSHPAKKAKLASGKNESDRYATSGQDSSGSSSLSAIGSVPVSSPSTPDQSGQKRCLRPRKSPSDNTLKRVKRPYVDVCLTEDDAANIVGRRVKIWWPLDEKWYFGEIKEYSDMKRKHRVLYKDNEEEWVNLGCETFKMQFLPGDKFRKTKNNAPSSYLLRPEDGVFSDPSSRTVSQDNSTFSRSFGQKKFYVRRRHRSSRNSGSHHATSSNTTTVSDNLEVQSPIRVLEPLDNEGHEDEGFEVATNDTLESVENLMVPQDTDLCLTRFIAKPDITEVGPTSDTVLGAPLEVGGRKGRIGRWPLSRNVAELLRFIEVRSGGIQSNGLLNQVCRGMLPVWNIGNLFSLKPASSTEILASGENIPSMMKSSKSSGRSSLCMLISWNGFTLERNARLREVLETSLRRPNSVVKAPRRDYSFHGQSDSYLSVTLLCAPSNGRLVDPVAEMVSSVPATEFVFTGLFDGSAFSGGVQFNTRPLCIQTRRAPREALLVAGDKKPPVPRGLRKMLRELSSSKGLQLSVSQSLALLSSRCVFILLRIHLLNKEAVLLLERDKLLISDTQLSIPVSTSTTSTRPGLQELLSMSRKGRRSSLIKGMKRLSSDESLPPPKRIRIESVPVKVEIEESEEFRRNVPKPRRSPLSKSVWSVATSTEVNYDDYVYMKKRSPVFAIDDDDMIETDASGHMDFEEGYEDFDEIERRKRRRGAFGGYDMKRNTPPEDQEYPPCTANILIVQSDRGWREYAATVELHKDGESSFSLVVSLNNEVLYTYKAERYIQPGTANKYTHALMWRGGNDWILEFTDKAQWSTFRAMHDACCDRNLRVLKLKHIPIPGVREVPDSEQLYSATFSRPRYDYIRNGLGEIEMALRSSSRVLYDMDSEDEEWIEGTGGVVTDELLERIVHQLERAAYFHKQEFIPLEMALEVCSTVASPECVKLVHAHWVERRRKNGMALIRCFQPAPCERYDAQVKAWEADKMGRQQPTTFAFCLRRDVQPNKMQKQRSQRRMSARHHYNPPSPVHFEDVTVEYLEDVPGRRIPVEVSPTLDHEIYPGSPGSDADSMQRLVYTMKQRTTRGRKPGRKPRRMKSMNEETNNNNRKRSLAEQIDGADSCSSVDDRDLNEEARVKAKIAKQAARVAAEKAARAQALYAHADAAMKKAVAALIEAEALAAAEKAAREAEDTREYPLGYSVPDSGYLEDDVEDDDLLIPVQNWNQEYMIQKGGEGSPPKGVKYMQSSLFKVS